MSATVAAFDFDGTLIRGDSLIPFLASVRGWPQVVLALARHGVRLALAIAGLGDRSEVKSDVLSRVLAGVDAARFEDASQRFAETLIPRLRPEVLRRVAWHRQQGHEIVVVSASLVDYLDHVGRHLGARAVLATRLERGPDGRLTGRFDGQNCRGDAKVDRLREWLDGRHVTVWAYGDSAGDRELLAFADRGELVPRHGLPAAPTDKDPTTRQ